MRSIKPVTTLISALTAASLLVACGDNIKDGTLEVEGLYYVESSFQTPRGLPEIENADLNSFLALADRPDRVSAWVLEILEEELDEPYKSGVRYLRDGGGVEDSLQEFLEREAPEFVIELSTLASDIAAVTTSLHFMSELTLTEDLDDELIGVVEHRITGMIFKLGTAEYLYGLDELGIDAPSMMKTDYMRHDDEAISFGTQSMGLAYGKVLNYAINEVIVENADPFADSFTDLVTSMVPCDKAGEWMEEKINFGPSEIYGAACSAAFDQLFIRLMPLEIEDINIAMSITGDATLDDDGDDDLRADRIIGGQWEGSLSYPSQTISLLRPDHTFIGNRSRASRNNDDDVQGRR